MNNLVLMLSVFLFVVVVGGGVRCWLLLLSYHPERSTVYVFVVVFATPGNLKSGK